MRLIDADALMPNAEFKGKYDVVTALDIANAPTIEMPSSRLVVMTKETQWIPCSEQLPEDNSDVLVTTKQGFIYIALIEDWNGTMCWSESVEYRFLDDVVAWMPLPKPYEGE